MVRTLDTGESVRLQYRSLQKTGEELRGESCDHHAHMYLVAISMGISLAST